VAEDAQWWPVWRWLRWFIAGGGTVSLGLTLLVLYLLGDGHGFWSLAGSINSLLFGSMNLASGVAEYRRQHAHIVSHTLGLPGLPPSS
jgi:hypothetical protein